MEGREKLYMDKQDWEWPEWQQLCCCITCSLGLAQCNVVCAWCGVSEVTVLADQQISSAKPYAAVATVFHISCYCFVSLHNFYSQSNIMSKISNKLFLMLELQCWFHDIIMKFQFWGFVLCGMWCCVGWRMVMPTAPGAGSERTPRHWRRRQYSPFRCEEQLTQ